MLGEHWFIHRFDPALPLTAASAAVSDQGVDLAESAVRGLVVLTQTCDIVRTSRERPFLEVAPLVEVSAQVAHEIERGRRPVYAIIPALRTRRLVADLDRTMTVAKAVVAQWVRMVGCRTDAEARRFALALVRKRARVAFPDDFTVLVEDYKRACWRNTTNRAMKGGRCAPSGRFACVPHPHGTRRALS